ncbi:hypothetical protein BC936DRAFT_140978 [Jimgerdemannia flammicorona]|uniref:RBR-type E3 ubiquitin transferase n=1 Tax=Jimgerdemannia flammicorona TaxID=994334 RepID=A0A433A341_9FUNG|nr:hypothetical protein BC936DRAFT_140978 [Jimgerdemannia flammicorona]
MTTLAVQSQPVPAQPLRHASDPIKSDHTHRKKKQSHPTVIDDWIKVLATNKSAESSLNTVDDVFCEIAAKLEQDGCALDESVMEFFLVEWLSDEEDRDDARLQLLFEQVGLAFIFDMVVLTSVLSKFVQQLLPPAPTKGKSKSRSHLARRSHNKGKGKGKGKSVARNSISRSRPHSLTQPLTILEEHEEATRQRALEMPTYECGICFDTFHLMSDTPQPADASSTTNQGTLLPCTHGFCSECLSGFISHKLKEASLTFPIACPSFKCTGHVSDVVAERALGKEGMEVWWQKVVESGLQNVIYCPHKGCGAPMELDPDIKKDSGPVECWECHRGFCGNCLTMWHTGTRAHHFSRSPDFMHPPRRLLHVFVVNDGTVSHQLFAPPSSSRTSLDIHAGLTCKQYQSLPPSQRNPEEVALLNLATSMSWHRCPKCRALIERNQGCNHMTCRCKAEFCYRCGNMWANQKCTVDCHLWNDEKLREERMRLGIIYSGEDAKANEDAKTTADKAKAKSKGKSVDVVTISGNAVASSSRPQAPARLNRASLLTATRRNDFTASTSAAPVPLTPTFRTQATLEALTRPPVTALNTTTLAALNGTTGGLRAVRKDPKDKDCVIS